MERLLIKILVIIAIWVIIAYVRQYFLNKKSKAELQKNQMSNKNELFMKDMLTQVEASEAKEGVLVDTEYTFLKEPRVYIKSPNKSVKINDGQHAQMVTALVELSGYERNITNIVEKYDDSEGMWEVTFLINGKEDSLPLHHTDYIEFDSVLLWLNDVLAEHMNVDRQFQVLETEYEQMCVFYISKKEKTVSEKSMKLEFVDL